jgi:hypothetical protein
VLTDDIGSNESQQKRAWDDNAQSVLQLRPLRGPDRTHRHRSPERRGRSPDRHSGRGGHPHRSNHSNHQQQGSRNNRYDDHREHKRSRPNVDPADIKIGGTQKKLEFTDNGSIVTCNKVEYSKVTLCRICKCGFDDKCWPVALSTMEWPWNLRVCNKAGEPGHESHNSSKHRFTAQQLQDIRQLREAARGK